MTNRVRVGVEATGVGKASSEVDRLRDRFDKLQKQGAKGVAIGVGVAATTAGLNVLGNAVGAVGNEYSEMNRAASDLSESQSKSRVIFGDLADEIDQFGDTAAASLGLSKRAAIEASATFGNLFVGLDLGQEKAADMSKGLVTLAGDLASFNNLDPTDVLEKLRAGLAGEAEPLRSVGVFLNEAKVKAKAMELGLGDAHGELTDGEKVLARYKLIMEETTTAQGDFARTSDGVANSQRKANAELENTRAELGKASEGANLLATQLQLNLFRGIQRVSHSFGELGDAIGEATEALTPWDEAAERAADAAAEIAEEDARAMAAMSDLGNFAGKTKDDVAGAADGMGDAVKRFGSQTSSTRRTVVKNLGDIADAFDETWDELSGTIDQAAEDIFGPLERRAELARLKVERAAEAKIINAPVRSTGEIDSAKADLKSYGKEMDALADKAAALAKIVDSPKSSDAEVAKARAGLKSLQKEYDSLTAKIKGANEVIGTPGPTKEEIAEARANLLGLQREYFELVAEMAGRGELSNESLIDFTNQLKDQLKSASAEETASILNLMTLLDRLIAKGKQFKLGTSGGLQQGDRTPTGSRFSGARASGGPVAANKAYVVGEEGPELFVPNTGGAIVPNGGSGTPVGGLGSDPAILNALNQQTAYLARIAAGEPNAARPMTARGDLARQAALMPGGRL